MERSSTFDIQCASTAPTPYSEASQAKMRGKLGSKQTNRQEEFSSSLDRSKAFSSAAFHLQ